MISEKLKQINVGAGLIRDERAVSVSVDHVLGIAILLIITGVFLNGVSSNFTERENIVVEKELERITENVANELIKTDSIIEHDDTTDTIEIENRVMIQSVLYKQGYIITVREEDNNTIITGESGEVTVQTQVELNNNVNRFSGSGMIIIKYDGNNLTLNNP